MKTVLIVFGLWTHSPSAFEFPDDASCQRAALRYYSKDHLAYAVCLPPDVVKKLEKKVRIFPYLHHYDFRDI